MGQGGRASISFSPYSLWPSVSENRVGEFIAPRQSMASGHSRSSSCDSSASSSAGYIEHPVSRFDTLAGVAIKYGVEVGDIKRMNGLLTDLQMFALKFLKIPIRGRHPPTNSPSSPRFSGIQKPVRHGKQSNVVLGQALKESSATREPDKGPVTSAMGLLRGYYGLSTAARQGDEGTEMAVYKSDSDYHSEDEPFSPMRPLETPHMRHSNHESMDLFRTPSPQFPDSSDYKVEGRRSTGKAKAVSPFEPFANRSKALLEIGGDPGGSEGDWANDRLFRRRSKGEVGGATFDIPLDLSSTPVAEGNDRPNIPLGKSSALRQKLPPSFEEESERAGVNSPLNGWHSSSEIPGLTVSAARALGTSLLGGKTVEGLISKMRRSSSNPTLQEEKKSYRGDSSGTLMVSQGSSQSGSVSSVLDGFPKPGVIRRNKAALD